LSHRSRLASLYTWTDQPQPIDAIGPNLRSVNAATSRAALSSCARCRTIALPKAVSLQRTGRLGTYAVVLGQEAEALIKKATPKPIIERIGKLIE